MPVIPVLQKATERGAKEAVKHTLRTYMGATISGTQLLFIPFVFLSGDESTNEPDWERDLIEWYERRLAEGETLNEWETQNYIEVKGKKDGVYLTPEDLRNPENFKKGPEEREFPSIDASLNKLKHFTDKANPDISLVEQLQGTGQLKDLRNNPNLEGFDIEDLLSKTPREIEDELKGQEGAKNVIRQINKAFEGRDLGKRGKNKK